jgi:hypothetical protein
MDLSVLIPARNEMFLNQTIDDLLAHSEADTEVVVTLDGAWPVEPVPDHPRVTLIYHPVAVGQRAATNDAARIARGRYVMKCDAHCAFGQGYDRIMLEDMEPDITMVPRMHNLHAWDWVCPSCGWRKYQGLSLPGGCPECGSMELERELVWKPKPSPVSTAMRFDRNLKFQYWSGYKKRQGGKELRETMSLLGACWLLERDRYFELDICDEGHGGWGQQGTEVACKTWLSGGRLICTTKTWFAHMFRTQGGDFGFPYPISGGDTRRARKYSRELWRADAPHEMPRWDKAVRPLSWLIEKFAPVPDWEDYESGPGAEGPGPDEPEPPAEAEEDDIERETPEIAVRDGVRRAEGLGGDHRNDAAADSVFRVPPGGLAGHTDRVSKAIVYYTDNQLDPTIMAACQRQLERAGFPIVSVSLRPIDFGCNAVVEGERGPLTMFRQILGGLEIVAEEGLADVVFFAEHDVLYHPTHFEFEPEDPALVYYNNHVWKVDAENGRALFHYSNHTSQLCARLPLLLGHYRRRVAICEERGFSRKMGFEPGTHGRPERVDDLRCDTWMGEHPNLDLRHGDNLTQTRWRREEFRNQRFTRGWTEADHVPPWYEPGGFRGLLEKLSGG